MIPLDLNYETSIGSRQHFKSFTDLLRSTDMADLECYALISPQLDLVTKANKMKEYHLSMSHKKPIKTINRDISREKMPKKKIKKGNN